MKKLLLLIFLLPISSVAYTPGPHLMQLPVPQDWVHRDVQPAADGKVRWNRCVPCHSATGAAKAQPDL